MTAHEVSVKALKIVNNNNFTFDDVVGIIDKGMGEISYRVLLPELEAVDDIETTLSQATTPLPDNFQRNLKQCISTTNNKEIQVYSNYAKLARHFPNVDQGGRVIGVAVQGSNLYYQRIPSSVETLRINYYKKHTPITGRTSAIVLPEALIMPLLANYVASELFGLIEQGEQSQKKNTNYYDGLYLKALSMLALYIGPEARLDGEFTDEINLEGYL